jgi:hypothetical protein
MVIVYNENDENKLKGKLPSCKGCLSGFGWYLGVQRLGKPLK